MDSKIHLIPSEYEKKALFIFNRKKLRETFTRILRRPKPQPNKPFLRPLTRIFPILRVNKVIVPLILLILLPPSPMGMPIPKETQGEQPDALAQRRITPHSPKADNPFKFADSEESRVPVNIQFGAHVSFKARLFSAPKPFITIIDLKLDTLQEEGHKIFQTLREFQKLLGKENDRNFMVHEVPLGKGYSSDDQKRQQKWVHDHTWNTKAERKHDRDDGYKVLWKKFRKETLPIVADMLRTYNITSGDHPIRSFLEYKLHAKHKRAFGTAFMLLTPILTAAGKAIYQAIAERITNGAIDGIQNMRHLDGQSQMLQVETTKPDKIPTLPLLPDSYARSREQFLLGNTVEQAQNNAFFDDRANVQHFISTMGILLDLYMDKIQKVRALIQDIRNGRLSAEYFSEFDTANIFNSIIQQTSKISGFKVPDDLNNAYSIFEYATPFLLERNNKYFLVLATPLISTANDMDLYKIRHLPFFTKDDVPLEITNTKSYIAVTDLSANQYIAIDDTSLQECEKRVINTYLIYLCYNGFMTQFSTKSSCELALYFKSKEDILKSCMFEKSASSKDMFLRLGPNYYMYFLPNGGNLKVNCPKQAENDIVTRPLYKSGIISYESNCQAKVNLYSFPDTISVVNHEIVTLNRTGNKFLDVVGKQLNISEDTLSSDRMTMLTSIARQPDIRLSMEQLKEKYELKNAQSSVGYLIRNSNTLSIKHFKILAISACIGFLCWTISGSVTFTLIRRKLASFASLLPSQMSQEEDMENLQLQDDNASPDTEDSVNNSIYPRLHSNDTSMQHI